MSRSVLTNRPARLVLVVLFLLFFGKPLLSVEIYDRTKGENWKINVIFAKNKGSEFTERGDPFGMVTQIISTDKPDAYLLQVRVHIKRIDQKPIGFDYFKEAIVRDDNGKTYLYSIAGPPGFYLNFTKKGEYEASPLLVEGDVDYIFIVPDNAKIVDFVWLDQPPIPLTVESAP
ncbi:hypothetical protein ES702_05767 [subsurface metagenome]